MNIHLIALAGVTVIALVFFRIGRSYERRNNTTLLPYELDADEKWIIKHPELLFSSEEQTSKAILRLKIKRCRIITHEQQKAKELMEQERHRNQRF